MQTENGDQRRFLPLLSRDGRETNFEETQTEIGSVSADYFTYIGPFDRDIDALSEKGYVICDGREYTFKKKQKVLIGDKVQFYWAVLRQKTEGGYDNI